MAAVKLVRLRPTVTTVYVAGAGAAVVAFVAAATVVAVTLPYHDWDSFAFGSWSRAIAEHGKLDPLFPGALASARPVFYELQGLLWSLTGTSFAAGRLLSLAFTVLLLGSVWSLVRAFNPTRLEPSLALLVMLAIPSLAQDSLAGKSDVPAAAMVSLAAAQAVRRPATRTRAVALGATTLAAGLTKPTVLLPLGALTTYLLVLERRRSDGRSRAVPALVGGLVLSVSYDLVMALRFHTGLVAYLRSGTTDGLWAQRAAQQRWDALLRADVLGAGLRLALTSSLIYGVARLIGARHRRAAVLAIPGALLWSIAGPLAADVPNGAFMTSESGFTLIGFSLLFGAAAFLRSDDGPDRRTIGLGLALGVPPLLAWLYATPYFDRLAATAWPGLAILIAHFAAAGVRALHRVAPTTGLVALPVLAMAVWVSLATLDGLHGPQWVEYRSLGLNGLNDDARTLNIVLPAVQSALATANPHLGAGRLSTSDPRFTFFLPGRVETTTALHCHDLAGYRVFILLTSDESEQTAKEEGGLATPEQWARCAAPKLRQLSDGTDGFAIFAVA